MNLFVHALAWRAGLLRDSASKHKKVFWGWIMFTYLNIHNQKTTKNPKQKWRWKGRGGVEGPCSSSPCHVKKKNFKPPWYFFRRWQLAVNHLWLFKGSNYRSVSVQTFKKNEFLPNIFLTRAINHRTHFWNFFFLFFFFQNWWHAEPFFFFFYAGNIYVSLHKLRLYPIKT